jgi:DNA-binding NarL/FixJ family response regulator
MQKAGVMSLSIRVHICADPVSEAGIVSQLRHESDLVTVTNGSIRPSAIGDVTGMPTVSVVVADRVNDDTIERIREARQYSGRSVVLIVGTVDEAGVLLAVETGVMGLLRRDETTPARLAEAIRRTASGDGVLPPDLLGKLLRRDDRAGAQPRRTDAGAAPGSLTHRELTVLRLVAEGYSTSEIAEQLAYSERTVKSALHDLTSRYQLRNRSHAVAFAMREGLI